MTFEGPGKKPIISFGGAKFLACDVKSKRVETNENGKKTYIIDFVNGTKLSYPAQAAKNQANARLDGDYTNDMEINRFYGLEVTLEGDKDAYDPVAHVRLEGTKNCTVDASKNKREDVITIKDDTDIENTRFKSSGNKVIMDNKDAVIENHDVIDPNEKGTTVYNQNRGAANPWQLK